MAIYQLITEGSQYLNNRHYTETNCPRDRVQFLSDYFILRGFSSSSENGGFWRKERIQPQQDSDILDKETKGLAAVQMFNSHR